MRRYALLVIENGDWKVRSLGSLENIYYAARPILAAGTTVKIMPFDA